MHVHEREPQFLIAHDYLEPCQNFEHNGCMVPFDRMGYRITKKFVKIFAGRVLSCPDSLFTNEILRPEEQDPHIFADSMSNIIESHKNAAGIIMSSTDIAHAIPPLKALLDIMYYGQHNGLTPSSKDFREMFKRENVINSDWYLTRLVNKQTHYANHLKQGMQYLQTFAKSHKDNDKLNIEAKITEICNELPYVNSSEYVKNLIGTTGRCPI
jgi:hypothetical protein